jgi:hypothetical protein
MSTLLINAVNSTGYPLNREGYNMFMQLLQNNRVVSSCYAPCSFTVHNGQTYEVDPSNWGHEIFSHWQNDNSTDYETVSLPDYNVTVTLVAVYNP